MTLGGLALAVGILIDEGTVVIENIHVQMAKHPSLAWAILVGTKETVVPILLAMLCVLAVFLPSFLMRGAARGLFVPLSLSVGFAMMTAFVLSITFVPVLAVWLLRHIPHDDHAPPGRFSFARFRHVYGKLVERILPRRWIVFPVYLVLTAALLVLVGGQVGQEIAPTVDSGQFQLRIKAPTGTRLEITEEMTRQALDIIKQELGPDKVKISVSYVGVTAPTYTVNAIYLWTGGTDTTVIRISLVENSGLRVEEVQRRLRRELVPKLKEWLGPRLRAAGVSPDKIPQRLAALHLSFEPADVVNQVMSFGANTPIEVVASGPNQADNKAYADKVLAQMAKIPTLQDLQFGQAFDYPRVMIDVNRERAGFAGLTEADLAAAMITATSSSRYIVPVFWSDPKSGIGYQIQLQVPPPRMNSLEEVGMIPVRKLPDGRGVALLRDLARLEPTTMPQEFDRLNQKRMVTITANVVGEDLGRAAGRIDKAIKAAGEPPRGVRLEVRGQVPPMREMFQGLASGLGLAVVVIFLLLAAYFQSIRLALVATATVPAVVSGVAVILLATHTTLNVQSFMGAIMAVGVAVANAILLVTFAERARQTGQPALQAALTGASERLRPILMTSFAMIIGMVPMALGLGEGGEQSAPLGRAVIGGLAFATLSTLLVLPTVFALAMGRSRIGSVSLHPSDPESRYHYVRHEPDASATDSNLGERS